MSSASKVIPNNERARKRSSTGDETGRCHRKQAKSDVIRQVVTSPGSPGSRDSSSDDGDTDVTDSISLPRLQPYYLLNLLHTRRSESTVYIMSQTTETVTVWGQKNVTQST